MGYVRHLGPEYDCDVLEALALVPRPGHPRHPHRLGIHHPLPAVLGGLFPMAGDGVQDLARDPRRLAHRLHAHLRNVGASHRGLLDGQHHCGLRLRVPHGLAHCRLSVRYWQLGCLYGLSDGAERPGQQADWQRSPLRCAGPGAASGWNPLLDGHPILSSAL